ncbi:MAG: hypothetical protein WCF22_19590, partial [Candidatus Sulfotelmatobacter sp.]
MNRTLKLVGTLMIANWLMVTFGALSLLAQEHRKFQLDAQSTLFWELVDHNAKLSVVGSGFGFT